MPTRTNEYGGTDLPFLLSNLLLSVLPNVPDARIVAVTIGYVSFVCLFGVRGGVDTLTRKGFAVGRDAVG